MEHLKLAISENSANKLFSNIASNFHPTISGSTSGNFRASYSAGVKIVGGNIDFQADNSIRLDEIDILIDPLSLTLEVNIPTVTIGGFCIIPNPFGGCILRAPKLTLFSANPDITIPLNLGGLITSEISGTFIPEFRYAIDPNRTPSMSYLDAEDAGFANKWKLFINPNEIDFDLIDISDTIGNILDRAIDNVVDGLLGWLPGWAKDLIKAILGSLVDVIRAILDIGDDIQEWLSGLLGTSLGLFNKILELVADYFASKTPLFEIEDPFPILNYNNGLIPVKIPIGDLNVSVSDKEMLVKANIKASL